MILREQLIKEINQMPPEDLMLLQHLIRGLGRRARAPKKVVRDGYLEARKALSTCGGDLSDEISLGRNNQDEKHAWSGGGVTRVIAPAS